MKLTFWVPGIPRPGGSKTAFVNKHTGRANVVDAGKGNKEWKSLVAHAAREAHRTAPFDGPLLLRIVFNMPRPKSHRRKDGTTKPFAPYWHVSKPDATKLTRSTEDALTGLLWHDDTQVVCQEIWKHYTTEQVGAQITIEDMPEKGREDGT